MGQPISQSTGVSIQEYNSEEAKEKGKMNGHSVEQVVGDARLEPTAPLLDTQPRLKIIFTSGSLPEIEILIQPQPHESGQAPMDAKSYSQT